jgi:hypothetical protein
MIFRDHKMFKPDRSSTDARRAKRTPICLPVFVIAPDGEPYSALAVDVATHGFRIRSGYPATLGRFLVIDVPSFVRYSGWVAWASTTEFGFDVAHPMPADVVNHLISLARED